MFCKNTFLLSCYKLLYKYLDSLLMRLLPVCPRTSPKLQRGWWRTPSTSPSCSVVSLLRSSPSTCSAALRTAASLNRYEPQSSNWILVDHQEQNLKVSGLRPLFHECNIWCWGKFSCCEHWFWTRKKVFIAFPFTCLKLCITNGSFANNPAALDILK